MATTFLQVKNNATSTLSAGVDDVVTVFPVVDVTKYPSTYPFHASIEDEIISVAGKSGSDLDPCTRAQEGTSAVAHSTGVDVELLITAQQMSDIHTAIIAIENAAGDYLLRDGSLPLTGSWIPGAFNIGNYDFGIKALTLELGDGNFQMALAAGLAALTFDSGDGVVFNRSLNRWSFQIGGSGKVHVTSSGLSVDTVAELTPDTGVTLDGVLLKDGKLAPSALPFAIYIPFGSEESYAP